jgi:hypothetical protein
MGIIYGTGRGHATRWISHELTLDRTSRHSLILLLGETMLG